MTDHKTVAQEPPQRTGADSVVEALLDHGISNLYCLPGIQNDALFNALFDRRDEINVIHTRHEQGAAYMALGSALATGKPAVYAVVPGPGFLNTTAALATAYSTGAKVLCLSGQIPSHAIGKGLGYLHELPDQLGILERLTKSSERIGDPDEITGGMARAFRALNSGRPRPVGVEIPLDVLFKQASATAPQSLPMDIPDVLDEAAIERAAALLSRAAHPLIFVGGGAQDASAELRILAERLGAPVVSYRMGRGILDERNPLSQSLTGGHVFWRDCDVVLAVGTRLHLPLIQWGVDAALKIIKVDIDPAEMPKNGLPDIAIVGNAAAVLARMNEHIRRPVSDSVARIRRGALVKQETSARISGLEPQLAFLRAIRDVLPDNGVLVDESTQVGYVSRIGYETRLPRTYLSSGYQGVLGWGFATALGAKHALADTSVISIAGDGGFMFNVQEMSTAVHHSIPLTTIVFNDGSFGNVKRMQQDLYGNRVIASDLTNPDFARLADCFGALGMRAENPHDLRRALETALSAAGPSLIEVPCEPMPEAWPFINLPRIRGRA